MDCSKFYHLSISYSCNMYGLHFFHPKMCCHSELITLSFVQVSRSNYTKEIAKLSEPPPEDGTESPQRLLDLARAALEIAAEDDALVSHSPVPLPVDSYIDRLESMAVEFAGHYLPPQNRSPQVVFEALDLYLYGYKVWKKVYQSLALPDYI